MTEASDDVRCSFCGKHQREVRKLIAGPDVVICDECIMLCIEILVEDDADLRYPHELLLAPMLRRLESQGAGTSGLWGAALALASGHPDALRDLMTAALTGGASAGVLEAYAAIPEGERRLTDQNQAAVAHYRLGQLEEAAALYRAMDPQSDDDVRLRDANLISVELRLERDLDVVRLERMLKTLDAMREQVGSDPHLSHGVETSSAEVLIRLGRPVEGEKVLREMLQRIDATPLRRMLLANALLAQGERARAIAEYERAEEKVTGFLRGEVAERLQRARSDPYR